MCLFGTARTPFALPLALKQRHCNAWGVLIRSKFVTPTAPTVSTATPSHIFFHLGFMSMTSAPSDRNVDLEAQRDVPNPLGCAPSFLFFPHFVPSAHGS